jgi:DNA-directed RNA polymerase subunit RPC12/RpoP
MHEDRHYMQSTGNQSGDFVHFGDSPKCEGGRIQQSVDDEGQVTYLCCECKRQWQGEDLKPLPQLTDNPRLTDSESGNFVHFGDSPKCEGGRIQQSVDDEGQVTYLCCKCERQWRGEDLKKPESIFQ